MVHCLRKSLRGVLNNVVKKDSAYDKTYCDNEHIYNICPVYLILENGLRKILYLRMLISTVSVINTVLSEIY